MRFPARTLLIGAGAALSAGCASGPTTPVAGQPVISKDTVQVALNDLGTGGYRGFQGGLYPGGSNVPPADHDAAGLGRRNLVRPLDVNGNPSGAGKFVLISIGMSNTTQEWCSASSAPPCESWTFTGRAVADPSVNHTTLVMVNGAAGGQTAATWASPTAANYDRIRDTRLAPLGLSEKQVQVAWVKLADANPAASLPSSSADAYSLLQYLGSVLRTLRSRYPNLQQVFISSRIYAGYATTTLNPEPYAYESGFSVKWVIEAQINQMRGAAPDSRAGNLNYNAGSVPWVAWGPYLWADGMKPRSDGLTWARSELAGDGTHPSQPGESKIGAVLLDFFKTSPYTRCWFLSGQIC